MKQIYICLAIFISLAASRFIPHPPNFTSLIALSFYVPAFLGIRYLPVLIVSFAITDFIIGYHTGTHWTWGSVLLIGLMSRYFNNNFINSYGISYNLWSFLFQFEGFLLGIAFFIGNIFPIILNIFVINYVFLHLYDTNDRLLYNVLVF